MAATTITAYSVQLNQHAPGNPQTYGPVKANEHYGRVRCSNFRLVLASQASGTSFALAIIPRGARILGGVLAASATLANTATLAVGLAARDGLGFVDDALAGGPLYKYDGSAITVGTALSDSTVCLKAAAAQGATQVPFALTQALGYLYETAKDLYLTITTGTGTVSTEVVTGHVLYVVD